MKKLLYLLLFLPSILFAQTTVRMSSTATGTNTYSTLFNPNVASFNSSTIYVIPFTNANSSGTITLDPDGGGPGAAVSIKGDDGNDLAVGAIKSGGTYAFKFNGTLLRMIGSAGGSGGWATSLTTNLTDSVHIDNGVHNLLIGDITGPYSSWDKDGTGPLSIPDSKTEGVGDPTSNDHTYVRQAVAAGQSEIYLSASESATSGSSSITILGNGASSNILLNSTGEIHFDVASVNRLHIDTDGSWDLGNTNDPGTSGYVLQSNGAGAAPTWEPASGGGGGTWGSITGTLSSQTDLQTALDARQLLVNSATTITDASTMDVTAIKNTLTTSSGTRTFTISYTGDEFTIEVTLNTTSSVFTFPATALTVSDGAASGNNTLTLTGVSGDKYIIASKKIGSNYYVVAKNFGQ